MSALARLDSRIIKAVRQDKKNGKSVLRILRVAWLLKQPSEWKLQSRQRVVQRVLAMPMFQQMTVRTWRVTTRLLELLDNG